MKEKLISLFKSKKGALIILVMGLCGILLVVLSGNPSDKKSSSDTASAYNCDVYTEKLENQVKALADSISSAEESASVSITLESGPEYIYATQSKTTADTSESSKSDTYQKSTADAGENEYIIIKTDDGEQALLITEISPKIKGVAIVLKGASADTLQTVKSSVATLLDISPQKISVVSR